MSSMFPESGPNDPLYFPLLAVFLTGSAPLHKRAFSKHALSGTAPEQVKAQPSSRELSAGKNNALPRRAIIRNANNNNDSSANNSNNSNAKHREKVDLKHAGQHASEHSFLTSALPSASSATLSHELVVQLKKHHAAHLLDKRLFALTVLQSCPATKFMHALSYLLAEACDRRRNDHKPVEEENGDRQNPLETLLSSPLFLFNFNQTKSNPTVKNPPAIERELSKSIKSKLHKLGGTYFLLLESIFGNATTIKQQSGDAGRELRGSKFLECKALLKYLRMTCSEDCADGEYHFRGDFLCRVFAFAKLCFDISARDALPSPISVVKKWCLASTLMVS